MRKDCANIPPCLEPVKPSLFQVSLSTIKSYVTGIMKINHIPSCCSKTAGKNGENITENNVTLVSQYHVSGGEF